MQEQRSVTEVGYQAPETTEGGVYLLDRLRLLQSALAEVLDSGPPAGWSADELRTLSGLVAIFQARLFASAPAAISQAYIEHLAEIQRLTR